MSVRLLLLSATVLVAAQPALKAQGTKDSIAKEIGGLRGVPDNKRSDVTQKIALEIRALPAGMPKVSLADSLSHLSTEGDPGKTALDAVAETLAQALKETPVPAKKPGAPPPEPYSELAKLIRYEHAAASLDDPQMERANAMLAADDADIEKADFKLKDIKGKTWTLSQLKGSVVLVNFWATWCPPCRKEMPDLDIIYQHFKSQGLVVLSLTDENPFKVGSYIEPTGYHPPVLLDSGGKTAKAFHVDGIPRSFVFDRDGKLVTESIDMRTLQQFAAMLQMAGIKLQ